MIERKPDEIAADKLQELICNYEENKQSVILGHLTAMHRLRDREMLDGPDSLWTACIDLDDEPDVLFLKVQDMQTFEWAYKWWGQ